MIYRIKNINVNKRMTFKDLAEQINSMTDEQKNCDVSVYVHDMDEFYPLEDSILFSAPEPDVLDPNTPYLQV